MKLANPWKQNPWFESVAVAQRRARKLLPAPVYASLLAGSERGQTVSDNQAAFAELGLAPHVAGHQPKRAQATTLLGQELSLTSRPSPSRRSPPPGRPRCSRCTGRGTGT